MIPISYLMGSGDSLPVFTVGYMKDKSTTVILLASAESFMVTETYTSAISKMVHAPAREDYSQPKVN